MKTLTIPINQWLHGTMSDSASDTQMYWPETNRLCCWGHYMEQFNGVSREDLAGSCQPSNVCEKIGFRDSVLIDPDGTDSAIVKEGVEANDSPIYHGNLKARMAAVKNVFKKIGVEVEFV